MPTDESASPFCGGQVRQIVGELIEPIDAGTGLQEKSKGGHRMKDHCVGTPLYGNGLMLCMVTVVGAVAAF